MRRQSVIFAALLVAAMLVLLPLRTVLSLAGADSAGLSARDVTGRVGKGALAAAYWRGAGLGDVAVSLVPLSLLGGALRYEVTGDQVRGAVYVSRRGGGVSGMTGRIGVRSIGGLPVQGMDFAAVNLGFADGVCAAAAGQIMVQPGGVLSGLGAMAGAPLCDGGAILVPLVSSDGAARVDLRVMAGGKFRAEVRIDKVDEAARAGLLAAGFQATPQGLAMQLEGVL